MRNILPKSIPDLLVFAGTAAIGAGEYGESIPLLQNTRANIDIDLESARSTTLAYANARAELSLKRAFVNTLAQEGRAALMLGRDNLKPRFGNVFNDGWRLLGHVDSLKVSFNVTEVLALLRAYSEYFASRPEQEIAVNGVTAAAFAARFAALSGAVGALNQQQTVHGEALGLRDEKIARLRKRVRGLIDELRQSLSPVDPRWNGFGFNCPGSPETPAQVEGLEVVVVNETVAAMTWKPSAGANHYRVWVQVDGSDAEPQAVGSPADCNFMAEELRKGEMVHLSVSAVNKAGEGRRSLPITIQLPKNE